MDNLKNSIIELVKAFAPQGAVIDENYDIQQNIDSLSIVSLLLNAEDEFMVEINMEDLDLSVLKSISAFAEFIEKLQ
ncbi:MAG: hypothetical protein IJZ16_10950 [Clostridia bacterium]|nr:hypothetical protein [Clostridia bacterium]